MEIKINKFEEDEKKIIKQNSVKKSSDNTFKRILDQSKDKINNDDIKSDEDMKKQKIAKISRIIQTYEAKDISKIFNIDLCKGDEKFFKKNGSVDIREIITKYGNKMSDNDLIKFEADLSDLWKHGDIDDDDYEYAMNWIIEKKQGMMVKNTVKSIEYDDIDNIVDGNK